MIYTEEELTAVFKLKRTKVRGENLMSSCPFKENHKDNYPSFGISMESGKYNCFSCGEKGESLRTLAYKLGILLPDDMVKKSLRKVRAKKKSHHGAVYLPEGFEFPEGSSAMAYKELSKRGIKKSIIEKYNVKKTDDGSIIFPCEWTKGKFTGFIKRNSKWDGRYGFAPEGVMRKFLLFGIDEDDTDEVFLVESMTDCLKLKTFGVNSVSTCGNMIFREQAIRIADLYKTVVLVPQRDRPAIRWIIDAETVLKGKIPVYGITIDSEFKDVGSAGYLESHWNTDKKTKKFLY